jgi:hypothetical protein
MKLLAEKRGKKYFIIYHGIEHEIVIPDMEKKPKKASVKSSKKKSSSKSKSKKSKKE